MLRLIALIPASMLAIACDSHAAQPTAVPAGSVEGSQAKPPPPPSRPTSVVEQVQQSAPDMRVAPAELTVPGLELFALTDSKPAAADEDAPAKLVGVAGGLGGKILDGRELVRAAIEAKPDRKTLARVALWVAQDDGEVLEAPQSREHKKAKVGPPAVSKDKLAFWVWTTDVPRTLERGKLDLTTGVLEIEPLPVTHDVAINNAMTTLGSVSISRHVVAIRVLGASCAEPRPRQALLGALANHPRIKTRAAAADEAHRCGVAAVDALINAMEQDRSGLVRRQAAAALGRIGASRARPALAKASRGEDANLAWAAKNALGKLK